MNTFAINGRPAAATAAGSVHDAAESTVTPETKPAAARALFMQMAAANKGTPDLRDAGHLLRLYGDSALHAADNPSPGLRRYLVAAGAFPEPPVKWPGGKRVLAEQILETLGTGDVYVDPFVGAGSVLLRALALGVAPRFVAGDVDRDAILMWQAIQEDADGLVRVLTRWARRWMVEDGDEPFYRMPEADYYELRAINPADLDGHERTARFILLNRACFNGLVRRNKNGGDNSPWGGAERVWRIGAANLLRIGRLVQGVIFVEGDFEATISAAGPGHLALYLDPPYWPDRLGGFTGYHGSGFDREDQARLARAARAAAVRGRVVASNNDVPQVRALYDGFVVQSVKVARSIARSIARNAEGRVKVGEVIMSMGVKVS